MTVIAIVAIVATAIVVAWVFHNLFEEALYGPQPMPLPIKVALGVGLVAGLAVIRTLGA